MTRFVALVGALLFGWSIASGETLPDAPKPHTMDRQFAVVFGILGASTAADYKTSVSMLGRGWIELNPTFGQHPEPSAYVWRGGGIFAAEVAVGYGLKRFGAHHRWARYVWLAEPVVGTIAHTRLAEQNARLGVKHGR